MKVLFVCDGNICRSPMAEALMRQTLADRNVNGIEVSSSGLVASPWSVAHTQLRRVLGPAYQLVENRPSQPLTQELVERSDLILGMENRHVRQILERYPGSKDELTRLRLTQGGTAKSKTFRTVDMEMYLPGFATATR